MTNGQRQSGVLLHLTSLPGPHGTGDLGEHAYHFVDWLVTAGQAWWQMLPVGPPGMANSPYMSFSAFAGSPMLVDVLDLSASGWLTSEETQDGPSGNARRVAYPRVRTWKNRVLRSAARAFLEGKGEQDRAGFEKFLHTHKHWLDDFALFQVLSDVHGGTSWTQWPEDLRSRKSSALKKAHRELEPEILVQKFIQWRFFEQWRSLRSYAHAKGVSIMGDLPIFVAHNSADVWANQGHFYLDEHGDPTIVAGVPPDYFSVTGQRWGNPLYRWDMMKGDGYRWWKKRLRSSMELFDLARIDHFRGFEAYWEIPASEKTAVNGRWVKGPGGSFFRSLKRSLKNLPIVAEDLGVITPEVTHMRDQFGFPGMKVLQFAFSDGPENNFLPHHHSANGVVYTGTHDNDTTIGWYAQATEHERDFVRRYFMTDGNEIHWTLIRGALQSVAGLALIPLQDILGLGTADRMNTPGTTDRNWEWRFTWDMVGSYHAERLYEMTALAGRCPGDRLQLVPYPEGKNRP